MKGAPGGIVAIVLTSFLWGTIGTAATFAPDVGPLAIGAAGLGVGGLLQAAIALPSLRRSRQLLQLHAGLVAIGAVAVAINPLAFYSSMHFGGVAIGTVVSLASAPLVSGILERVLERKPLGRRWMVAAFLGVLGSALLSLPNTGEASVSAPAAATGIGLGLVTGATYALYSWVVHRLMSRHQVERSASMGAVFGVGGALLIPVLVITGAPLVASAQSLAVAAYTALVPMFLGFFLFGLGLARVRASTATTLTLIVPAVATLLAVVVVGERPTAVGWVGLGFLAAVLIVLAIAPAHAVGSQPTESVEAPDQGNGAGTVPSLADARTPSEEIGPPVVETSIHRRGV